MTVDKSSRKIGIISLSVLSHHLAYGSVPRRFVRITSFDVLFSSNSSLQILRNLVSYSRSWLALLGGQDLSRFAYRIYGCSHVDRQASVWLPVSLRYEPDCLWSSIVSKAEHASVFALVCLVLPSPSDAL